MSQTQISPAVNADASFWGANYLARNHLVVTLILSYSLAEKTRFGDDIVSLTFSLLVLTTSPFDPYIINQSINQSNIMEPCLKRRRITMSYPPSLESWSQVIGVLDRSLYPTLLLHLGYVLSISPSNDDKSSADDSFSIITLLCKHWCLIVQSEMHSFVDIELEVDLCVQLLETSKTGEVVGSVLRVVEALSIDKMVDHVNNNDYLAKALVLHVSNNDYNDDYRISEVATQLLNKFATTSPCQTILYTAACVMRDGNDIAVDFHKIDRQLFNLGIYLIQNGEAEIDAVEGVDLFLWALSQSKVYAQKMSTNQHILKFLAHNRNHNKQLKTISTIAQYCPVPSISILLANFLIDKPDDEDRDVVLRGLLHCSMVLEPSDGLLDAILSTVRKSSSSSSSSESKVIAAELLCRLFEKDKTQSDDKLLILLLETNDVRVSGIAMAYITAQRQGKSCWRPNIWLLCSIANVASRNSATQQIQQQAVDYFAHCASADKSMTIEMARHPKLVEVLVNAAPNPVAMETLWEISTPISNRRILARHTGLLSSWIRFLRNIPPHNPRREVWKDRLMQLAGLL